VSHLSYTQSAHANEKSAPNGVGVRALCAPSLRTLERADTLSTACVAAESVSSSEALTADETCDVRAWLERLELS
jgi:hypothetical protein